MSSVQTPDREDENKKSNFIPNPPLYQPTRATFPPSMIPEIRDPILKMMSLTHETFNSDKRANYEHLEQLGDVFLNCIIGIRIWMTRDIYSWECKQFVTDQTKSNLQFEVYSRYLGLDKKAFVVGPIWGKTISDLFEALFGAIFVENDFKTAAHPLIEMVDQSIKFHARTYLIHNPDEFKKAQEAATLAKYFSALSDSTDLGPFRPVSKSALTIPDLPESKAPWWRWRDTKESDALSGIQEDGLWPAPEVERDWKQKLPVPSRPGVKSSAGPQSYSPLAPPDHLKVQVPSSSLAAELHPWTSESGSHETMPNHPQLPAPPPSLPPRPPTPQDFYPNHRRRRSQRPTGFASYTSQRAENLYHQELATPADAKGNAPAQNLRNEDDSPAKKSSVRFSEPTTSEASSVPIKKSMQPSPAKSIGTTEYSTSAYEEYSTSDESSDADRPNEPSERPNIAAPNETKTGDIMPAKLAASTDNPASQTPDPGKKKLGLAEYLIRLAARKAAQEPAQSPPKHKRVRDKLSVRSLTSMMPRKKRKKKKASAK